jgi:hypothetical protein
MDSSFPATDFSRCDLRLRMRGNVSVIYVIVVLILNELTAFKFGISCNGAETDELQAASNVRD